MKKNGRFNYNLWANNADPDATIIVHGELLRAGKKGQGQSFFDEKGHECSG